MSGRTSRLVVLFLMIVSSAIVALTGCGSESACGDKCTPRGPWQSPTTQAFRALMLVNVEELDIEFVDDDKGDPSCVMPDGTREYYLCSGVHTITATFNYDCPPSEGLLGEVEGQLLTIEQEFEAGHAYVAFFREHPYPKPSENVGEVASNVREDTEKYYWTLEIVDLAEAALHSEPEVERARLYLDRVTEVASAAD